MEQISDQHLYQVVGSDGLSDANLVVRVLSLAGEDMFVAIEHAMGGFSPDRIVIATQLDGESQASRDDLAGRVKVRFDLPVECAQVAGQ